MMWSSPRDNWARLVAAVVKRDEIWQLCHQDSITTTSSNYSAEILSISSNRSNRMSVSPQRQRPLATASVLQVPRSITQKLLSVWYGRRKAKVDQGQLQEFSREVLLKATDDFSDQFKIGCSNSGSVYHATLDDGRRVAIKRGEFEFVSRLKHPNLVGLVGYCKDSNEHLVVYEYMENGSLFDHLHTNHHYMSSPFTSWPKRIKVALEAARGIEYLHEYAAPRGDINSSNILLDATWTAKVACFGLPPQHDNVGYVDPEYSRLNVFTAKSDVYSFGIVLLELLTGCKAIHLNEVGVPTYVVDYVASCILKNEIDRVLDRRLSPPTPVEAVAYMGCLAAACVLPEGRDRPTMSHVVDTLENALAACFVTLEPQQARRIIN